MANRKYVHFMCCLAFEYFLDMLLFYGCSGANGGTFLSDVNFFWPAVMMASSACQAGASIIKVGWTCFCTSDETFSYSNSNIVITMAGICFH
jgi:hypothetical protein